MNNEINLAEVIEYINPSDCSYQDWVNVGMALKHEGYTAAVWEAWSSRDTARYHPGECERKWSSFNGNANPVTAGTIVQMAKNNGMTFSRTSDNRALDWDDEISYEQHDDHVVVDKKWIEGKEINAPQEWQPHKEIIRYLEALFDQSENVGYVMQSWEKDGKFLPANKGSYDRTAGQLIELLSKCNGDIGSVLGDYNTQAGAWIRFNPLDGKGVKNENVTEYKYALVESDNTDIERQNAIIREMELPVAVLVFSGKKSLHAIVRIDASSYDEYRKRVDFLYQICQKNGLSPDTQNRNPSRLSRLPGVQRGDNRQYIVDTNIGKASWDEWREWIDSVNDDLPDEENMSDVWDNIPDLAPPLIDGILRQGHKMLVAGPSKAGKSYALIELCCAIAEGKKWLGFPCTKGKVMYVNLELDRASCLHRVKDVYTALNWAPENLNNLDIWNLRGKSVPMDKLAPKLIRRAAKKNYIAVVIDPIYKVITGDENSADQMAHFCNQFDKVCTELGCAVIYCHHHSKGAQGGKRSMDRASGSGVFARDPDALLDLIELEISDSLMTQEKNNAACEVMTRYLDKCGLDDEYSQDDACSRKAMQDACRSALSNDKYKMIMQEVTLSDKRTESRTAWRIEGTLREFPKFAPINMWFDYPIHKIDSSGVLKDAEAEGDSPSWQKNFGRKKTDKERKNERKESIETAYEACGMNGKVTIKDLAEYLGVTEKTVRSRLKEHGDFWIDEGTVGKKSG